MNALQRVRIYDSTTNELSTLTLYPSDPKMNTLDMYHMGKKDIDEFIRDCRSFQIGSRTWIDERI